MTATYVDLQVSSASKQNVRVPISEASGADPTGDTVALAFPVTGVDPVSYVAGTWNTIAGIYYAQALIGPGTAAILPIGFYDVYVKISDNPETPVLFAGTLEVF